MSKSTYLEFAIQLAHQAGQLLSEYFQSSSLQTGLKADHSAVTEADLACDRLITQALGQQFPGDVLLSEESQPGYTAHRQEQSQAVWIIDPLDGTTNFSLGLPIWGVLLARVENGWPVLAVSYFPKLGELYTVQRGQGAFMNGLPIRVKLPDPTRPLPFFACCSRTHRRYTVSVPYKTRILGSTAYSICCVARGVAVIGFEATPKIWDLVGAWLLVEEAGGQITTLDGSQPFPLRPEIDYTTQSFPLLAAANGDLIDKARRQIIPR